MRRAAAPLDHQRPSRPAKRRLPLGDLLVDDVVDGGRLDLGVAAGPRRGEELLHHVGEPVHLGERRLYFLLHHGWRVRRVLDLLQAHGQRGEWCAQLVRRLAGESPLGAQQGGDPRGAQVEHVGYPVDFRGAVALPDRQRLP